MSACFADATSNFPSNWCNIANAQVVLIMTMSCTLNSLIRTCAALAHAASNFPSNSPRVTKAQVVLVSACALDTLKCTSHGHANAATSLSSN